MNTKMPMMVIMLIIIIAGVVYAVQGVNMHTQVAVEEDKFHALQEDYFLQSKAIRDGAETNSELNQQLVEIKNYPSTLLMLKLVGVGKMLTGIFIVLIGILMALMSMPMKLGAIIKDK